MDAVGSKRSGGLFNFSGISILPNSNQPIQAKLRVNTPGDRYEQEADAVAEAVLGMPEPNLTGAAGEEEEDLLANDRLPAISSVGAGVQRLEGSEEEEEEEELLQAKNSPNQAPAVDAQTAAGIQSMRGGGEPLPASTRRYFEPRFGVDLSKVRIHHNGQAAETARSANARAFTVGQDVVFGQGQFAPEGREGKRLLAHELTHVVQQRGGKEMVQRDAVTGVESENQHPLPEETVQRLEQYLRQLILQHTDDETARKRFLAQVEKFVANQGNLGSFENGEGFFKFEGPPHPSKEHGLSPSQLWVFYNANNSGSITITYRDLNIRIDESLKIGEPIPTQPQITNDTVPNSNPDGPDTDSGSPDPDRHIRLIPHGEAGQRPETGTQPGTTSSSENVEGGEPTQAVAEKEEKSDIQSPEELKEEKEQEPLSVMDVIRYEVAESNKHDLFNNTGYRFYASDGRELTNKEVRRFIRQKKQEGDESFIKAFPYTIEGEGTPPMYTIDNSKYTYYKYDAPQAQAEAASDTAENFFKQSGPVAIYEEYKKTDLSELGKMGSTTDPDSFEIVKNEGKRIYATPSTNSEVTAHIKYGEDVFIKGANRNGQFLFVITPDGRSGWVQKEYVARDVPTTKENLYYVKEGETLSAIMKREYGEKYNIRTGDDYRIIAMAVYLMNKKNSAITINEEKFRESIQDNALTNAFDPDNAENRAVYQSIEVNAGRNLVLPSIETIEKLKASGAIQMRSEGMNQAIDIGRETLEVMEDVIMGIAGFSVGVAEGFFGGIWDMLTGLVDAAGQLIDTLGSVFTGEIFSQIGDIYDELMAMDVDDLKQLLDAMLGGLISEGQQLLDNWDQSDAYDKGEFLGKVVGNILLEVLMAIFTGGSGNAAKWAGRLGKVAPKLVKILTKAEKTADKLIPDKLKTKRKGDKDYDSDNETAAKRRKALILAKVIAEREDASGANISEAIVALQVVKAKYPIVKSFPYQQIRTGIYKIEMVASRPRTVDEHFSSGKGSFPFTSLRGKSLNWIKKQKPKNWQTVPTKNKKGQKTNGWIWKDEKGNDRLRFMRGTGDPPSSAKNKYGRQSNGYFRWNNENGDFLDIDGNIIPRSDPDFQWKTHIPYEGL
ncbi:MAG: DUF4157 domain-containing protein [Lewinellaceae bacterium]|nr:DUF4157 domain-containing protein [Lewinellaceae bacterium]